MVRTRNLLYDWRVLRAREAPIRVVSIGNLAVGGTGKTPVSAWLIRELVRAGWSPAVLSRGYGADEALLHRRWNPQVPVIIDANRWRGACQARGQGRDVVVLDDGFQHRRLKRDLDIVLLSPAQRLPPRLLPRGPYREPLRALRRSDFVLVTAKGEHERASAMALAAEVRRMPGVPPVELFALRIGAWENLAGEPAPPPLGPPLVVCSIAEPTTLLRAVEDRAGDEAELMAFPDHHSYTEADVGKISERAGSRWVATTEKDAVKLAGFAELLPDARVLPLVPVAGERLFERLIDRLGTEAAARDLGERGGSQPFPSAGSR